MIFFFSGEAIGKHKRKFEILISKLETNSNDKRPKFETTL